MFQCVALCGIYWIYWQKLNYIIKLTCFHFVCKNRNLENFCFFLNLESTKGAVHLPRVPHLAQPGFYNSQSRRPLHCNNALCTIVHYRLWNCGNAGKTHWAWRCQLPSEFCCSVNVVLVVKMTSEGGKGTDRGFALGGKRNSSIGVHPYKNKDIHNFLFHANCIVSTIY